LQSPFVNDLDTFWSRYEALEGDLGGGVGLGMVSLAGLVAYAFDQSC